MGKNKKEDVDTFLRKKREEKQDSATMIISVDEIGTAFPVKLNKDINKGNFKKDLMNLIETNHQINLTSDHSISSSNSFKSYLNSPSHT